MNQRFEQLFDVKKCEDVILSLNKKNPNETLPDMLGGIKLKDIKAIQNAKDPEEYVKSRFPERINTCRYELLQIYFNIDKYNKVYQYFNCNNNVFTWDLDTIELLSKRPPNMVNSICDEHYPNVYAVMSFFPDLNYKEFFKGFSADTLWHVRKYFETEDENELNTLLNRNEAKKLFEHLEQLGLVHKLEDTNIYVAIENDANYRPKKRSRVAVSGNFNILEVLKNIFPSFEAFDIANKNKKLITSIQKKEGICNKNISIGDFQFQKQARNIIYVVFTKPSFFDFECYRFGTDTLERRLRESGGTHNISLVFKSKQAFETMKRSKHPLISDISKLCAIYYYIKIASKTTQFKLFKTIYFNKK